ncbi:hypothetical protein KAFR_0I00220 [Kazachstania africana CBS 2517]|uniref:ML-like domain-containing protein n=1 Tax=Kazachstania africana (strain ATCC 22294 / BCRC 22015 / CBS 2517 / CECT 1963 / NBRC 1671 / NRRL Y-8276) TaxID=1071382 RepID=H2AZK3_KAZAF|nr:hypothetical protein KAFR_0I00220 [Kazachstania africana CBS 2517]CCF59803.1 hypothetical protein KAFR_0I00220 [Kazachstania africana CBS 2517]
MILQPWYNLIVFLYLLIPAQASKYLKADSLLTCMDNSKFTANYFDVRFYPDNNTAVFDIDATTTISDKVVIHVEVITYGLNVIQKEFNLCSLNESGVCPLSPGSIDLSSSYTIDSSVTGQIPGIAYTVPDLDAEVRVVAYSINDTTLSTPLACVQAILSNGRTVQTKYAGWPIAAITGVGILVSGFVSTIGYSTTAAHIASNSISLFVYFQNLAITSMMGVSRVPPIAAAWVQNFQWSMGIIYTNFMQKIFTWYVQATGGTSTVVLKNKSILSISVQKRAYMLFNEALINKRSVSIASSSDDYNFDSLLDNSALYTTNERNITNYESKILILRGIERVAYKANIELSNLFLTGVVFFLFFLFVLVIALVTFKSVLELLTRANVLKDTTNFYQYRKHWGSIIKGTLFRLAVIAFPQISLLTIWEFTQVDSPAIIVDAIVIFIIIFVLLGYGTTRVFLKGRESVRLYKNPAYLLYGDTRFLNRYGFLYVQFQADKFWWIGPLLCYSFLRSLFVATLQTKGKAQALIIFIIELFYFGFLCWQKPYLDKRTNIFNIAIHLINLINSLFFLFFSNLFGQPAVVSSIMAVILFVMNAAFALFLLIFTIVTCTLALVHRNPDARYQPMKDDRVSFIPKVINGEGNTDFNKNKSELELFELRQAVMDTNETEQEKLLREEKFANGAKKTISFDDEVMSSYTTNDSSSTFNVRGAPNAIVQPESTLLGTTNNTMSTPTNTAGLKFNTESSSDRLRKPETSFYNGNSGHSYSRDFL